MPSQTVHDKCVGLLDKFFNRGDKVGSVKLSSLIITHIGGQRRTVQRCLEIMILTKLIKDIGDCHFEIL